MLFSYGSNKKKYSSECIANTLQNYPEFYKMEEAMTHDALLLTQQNNDYMVRGSV